MRDGPALVAASIVAAVLLALGASVAHAQTVGGIVRDRTSGAPAVEVSVTLRNSADSTVARTRSDSLGAFYLTAPGTGRYRVAFAFGARRYAYSAPFEIADSAAFHQAEFIVDVPERVYYVFEIDKPASLLNNVAPAYPAELQRQGIGGTFAVEFVVDTLGAADPESFVVLPQYPADPLFVEAVRKTVPRMRFLPAELNGRKVRQLVQQAFAFNPGR